MYDGGSYAGYPGRQGFDKTKLLLGDFSDKTPEEMASFYQSWLYFGLLHEVFSVLGDAYNPWDFVRTTADGRNVISTEKLRSYVLQWEQCDKQLTQEAKQVRGEALRDCFEELKLITERYCNRVSFLYKRRATIQPTYWPISPEITFSILVLAESLDLASCKILDWNLRNRYGISRLLADCMQKNGWCQNVLTILETSGSTQIIHYVTTLGKHAGEGKHDKCNTFRCREHDFDEATHVTKHTPDCSGCDFQRPPHAMFEILETGGTPIIRLSEHEGDLRLELAESQMHPYIAISHVCQCIRETHASREENDCSRERRARKPEAKCPAKLSAAKSPTIGGCCLQQGSSTLGLLVVRYPVRARCARKCRASGARH